MTHALKRFRLLLFLMLSVLIVGCSTDGSDAALRQATPSNQSQQMQSGTTDPTPTSQSQQIQSGTNGSSPTSQQSDQDSDESGMLYVDEKYAPFNRHMDVHGIRLFALDGVSDEIVTKIARTLENMWRDTQQIDSMRRDELRFHLKTRYVYQRIGYSNPDHYGGEPPGYPLLADRLSDDASEFTHNHIDYIWEKDVSEKDRQIIEVIEHLLHTLTDQGFRFAFPEDWNWQDPDSTLNLAMKQAISNGHYDIESYEEIMDFDPEGYNRVIATEFAFWMILTAWDMFEVAGVSANEEWNIESSQELRSSLPLAFQLYEATVATVLSPPDGDYILETFDSLGNTRIDQRNANDSNHDDDDHDHDDDREKDGQISEDDPRQEELNSFRKAVSDNTGPGCNIWTSVPCPEFPNFIKTEPSRSTLPVYAEAKCQGSFSGREYLLQTPKNDYVRCLINAGKSDDEPYFVAGAQIDAAIIDAIREAEIYGAEMLGNWGPIMNILVRYGEPDVEYVASQSCLFLERYSDTDYDSCREYKEAYYKTFDDCCGALHETPAALSPVRVQYFTYSAPEAAHEDGLIRKMTLHEYVHVWQSAHVVHPHSSRCSDEENVLCELGNGPLWLEEGTAEYFAQYFADKRGWSDFSGAMSQTLESAQSTYDRWGFTLLNSHSRSDKDALDRHECGCGGVIMYDMGLWGVAWLINYSGTNDAFLKEFYPNVAYIGYQQAFKNAFGLSLDDFYVEFGDWFAKSTRYEKLRILDQISRY